MIEFPVGLTTAEWPSDADYFDVNAVRKRFVDACGGDARDSWDLIGGVNKFFVYENRSETIPIGAGRTAREAWADAAVRVRRLWP